MATIVIKSSTKPLWSWRLITCFRPAGSSKTACATETRRRPSPRSPGFFEGRTRTRIQRKAKRVSKAFLADEFAEPRSRLFFHKFKLCVGAGDADGGNDYWSWYLLYSLDCSTVVCLDTFNAVVAIAWIGEVKAHNKQAKFQYGLDKRLNSSLCSLYTFAYSFYL